MKLSYYLSILNHWKNHLSGKSQWLIDLDVNPNYKPELLEDYSRSYASKINWNGSLDETRFPTVREPNGQPFCDPMIIAQMALGHWGARYTDLSSSINHTSEFLRLAQWFVHNQDSPGSWYCQYMDKSTFLSPYSALVQGQVISVLVRAHKVSGNEIFLETAVAALNFMLTPVEEGGTARRNEKGLFLEEYPRTNPNTVLNGWISAIFGIYDLTLATANAAASLALKESLESLSENLYRFNGVFWSYYNTRKSISSPYYHQVHITQLKTLELTFPAISREFTRVRVKFEKQIQSQMNLRRAVATKIYQKIKHPNEYILQIN